MESTGIMKSVRALLVVCLTLLSACQGATAERPHPPFDQQRAFTYLEKICSFGPRISGSEAMQQQQELLEKHFTQLGGDVRYQAFDATHPQTGQPVRMKNLLVSWHPQAKQRVLICCHYDTRPHPDREPTPFLRAKPFLGANDGASGVALMMELGNQIGQGKVLIDQPATGVDFVFFDGEELVYQKRDPYFLGSEHFAREYRDRPPQNYRYVSGVLLDMVAGANAKFYFEVNSLKYAPEVTRSVWRTAAQLGIRDFIARRKHEVLDDHIPLNRIAGIPTCDIIDFDYPYWHKRNDLPAACSAQTLGKVGRVVLAWLQDNVNTARK